MFPKNSRATLKTLLSGLALGLLAATPVAPLHAAEVGCVCTEDGKCTCTDETGAVSVCEGDDLSCLPTAEGTGLHYPDKIVAEYFYVAIDHPTFHSVATGHVWVDRGEGSPRQQFCYAETWGGGGRTARGELAYPTFVIAAKLQGEKVQMLEPDPREMEKWDVKKADMEGLIEYCHFIQGAYETDLEESESVWE